MSSPDPESMLQRQAEAWWVRLHSGQATRADADAFRQWTTLSAAHAQAWREVMRVWSALDPLLAEEAARHASRAGASRRFPWPGVSAALRSPGRRAFMGGAVAASVAAGVLAVDPPLGLWPSVGELAADYRTATGEQRQVALGEEVSVRMNTQTLINRIGAGANLRGVELLAGEAEVATAGNADFIVETGGGRLQARGARFNIRYTGPQVCVTCLDGRVLVSVGAEQRSVEAGRQVVYDRAGIQDVVRADVASVSTWRTGVLSFDSTPLADVIEEINRYRPGKVILRNEALGRTPVRMQLSLRSIDNALVMIRELYGAKVRSLPGGIVLLS
ncbi:FecR family protein [Variovorax sp. W2I14]|uniref:FecR family protein n=1 Tax=Variovorax sp. W2I14 TaxID=3042290 RepID=UPI003D1F1374